MSPHRPLAFAVVAVLLVPLVRAAPAAADDAEEAAREPIRTKASTKLRSAPKSGARVVGRVPAGRAIVVLQRQGRWVRIRHAGRSGWIERSALEGKLIGAASAEPVMTSVAEAPRLDPADDPAPAPAAKRDKKKKKAKQPTKKVARAAKVAPAPEPEPEPTAPPVAAAPAAAAPTAPAPAAETEATMPEDDVVLADQVDRSSASPRTPSDIEIRLRATGGYSAVSMRRSAATGEGNARSSFAGPTTEVALRATRSFGLVRVGVEGELLAAFGGALRHRTAGVEVSDTEARRMLLAGVASLGVGRRFRAAARAGYFHDQLSVASTANMARLPSELAWGPLVGGELGASLGPLDLNAIADLVVLGSFTQTPGLEDGEAGAPRYVIGRAEAAWRFGPRIALSARYRLDLAQVAFAGASVRQPAGSETRRSDRAHTALVGLDVGL
jgi:outer membrane biosynthesis protein TonB